MRFANVLVAAVVSCLGAVGCAGVHLHNEEHAKVAKNASAQYTAAKVSELGSDESKNLDAMLSSELETVRETHQLRLELAYMRMAADRTSVWEWWDSGSQKNRRAELGLDDMARAKPILRAETRVRQARRDTEAKAGVLSVKVGKEIACSSELDASKPPTDKVSPEDVGEFSDEWKTFIEACKELSSAIADRDQGPDLGLARLELDAIDRGAPEAERELAEAKRELDEARSAGEDPDAEQKIRDKAKRVARSLELLEAANAALGLGLASEAGTRDLIERIETALGAAASGNEADQATLTILAGRVPDLVGDVSRIRNRYSQPSVSNLVIEYQRQLVLLAERRARRALATERVALLERRAEFARFEVQQWKAVQDGLCNVAFPSRGVACETLAVSGTTCTAKGGSASNCALADPWSKLLEISGDPAYDVYSAVGAFARIMHARIQQDELDYRIIDLLHRESLVASRSAIAEWNALASTPIAQLDAFHASGITQKEIADLVARVLSFGALAVGVAE